MDRTTIAVSLTFTLAGAATLHWAARASEPSVVTVACQVKDEPPSALELEHAQRYGAAAALVSLANDWDEAAFRKLRGEHQRGADRFESQAQFIHGALGSCDAPLLHKHGKKQSRYYADCERGRLEVAPRVDEEGHLLRAYWGAQDVEPGEGVRAGAQGLLRLMGEWDDDFASHLLSPGADAGKLQARIEGEFERFGACEIDSVDIAGARGGIFILECDAGMRRMKVSLDREQRVRKARFWQVRRHRPGSPSETP